MISGYMRNDVIRQLRNLTKDLGCIQNAPPQNDPLARRKQERVLFHFVFGWLNAKSSRSQWPRGLRRRSTASRFLELLVRSPPGAWMFVSCECCLSSGRGLCVGLITRLEDA